jgi:hypothetical protein
VLRVTEPVEVLFYIGGTFHLRGKTEGSFKPTLTLKVNFRNYLANWLTNDPNNFFIRTR